MSFNSSSFLMQDSLSDSFSNKLSFLMLIYHHPYKLLKFNITERANIFDFEQSTVAPIGPLVQRPIFFRSKRTVFLNLTHSPKKLYKQSFILSQLDAFVNVIVYIEKELPQPQPILALGLLNRNPPPIRSSE